MIEMVCEPNVIYIRRNYSKYQRYGVMEPSGYTAFDLYYLLFIATLHRSLSLCYYNDQYMSIMTKSLIF